MPSLDPSPPSLLQRLWIAAPDPPPLRAAYRLICRRSMQFTAACCTVEALLLAWLDGGPWAACLAMALLALLCAREMRAEAPTRRVAAALFGFALALSALAALLTVRYGSAAAFHWPLFTLLLMVAVTPRLSLLTRWLLMLGFVAVLFGLGGQAGQVAPPPDVQRMLRLFNFLLMAVASLSLVMHYRALVCSLHEQISLLAETDALTGLLNRRALRKAADRLRDAQRRQPQAMALLLVDIDHFKQLNDRHGHEAGDEALRHFARVLEGVLRRGDLAARWGGEEFLVLLSHTGVEGAQRLGERLLLSLQASPLLVGGEALQLGATAGVAALRGEDDLDEALRHADRALYDGKRGGRNCVRLAGELAA